MAKQSWHSDPQRVETDAGMARTGAPKKLDPLRIHPGHASRTNTTVGAPPTGAAPDASSPLPTDVEKQHGSKTLPIPACHSHMVSDSARGSYRPDLADKVMADAVRPAADFSPLLHTLPTQTTED